VSSEPIGLQPNKLSTADALALSFALLAPVMGVALTTQFAASAAGGATPLSYLLAGLASLSLAYVVIQFTRRLPSAGFAYTYLSTGLAPSAGFVGGFTYAFAFLIGVPMTLGVASLYLTQLLQNLTGHVVSWLPFFVLQVLIIYVLSAYDIRISTRTQLWLALVSVAVVFITSLIVLAKGGAAGLTLAAFSPATAGQGFSGIGFGLVFGFTSFIGFEAAAVLGEETADPRRSIPRAILGAVLLATLFYVVVSYSLDMGFGIRHSAEWAQSSAPLNVVVTRFVNGATANVIDLMVAVSAFLSSLGGTNLVARILYSMGRQRALPVALGRVHPMRRTPVTAIVLVLVVALGMALTMGEAMGPELMFGFLATTASLGIIAVYVGIAMAGLAFFRRQYHPLHPIKHVMVPVVGMALGLFALYASLFPAPPPPLNLAPYIALAWIVAGVVVVTVMGVRDPEKVRTLGRILSEETPEGGGTFEA
jgi:amino acid transporter